MPKYLIPLFSGIGNVIQSIPFANEMKRRYGEVSCLYGSDFPEIIKVIRKIFSKVYYDKSFISDGCKVAVIPKRRSFSEYKSWFTDNNEDLPENFSTTGMSCREDMPVFKVVMWPECKPNWPCKQWFYFEELSTYFDNVALIGLERKGNFKNVTDYRGRLSLMETGGILKNADIFIGNEGGMAHYAAALGTKTYIIMGCTDPVKCMPPNNAIPISLNLNCQPCHFKNMVIENKVKMIGCDDRKCLKDLSSQNVFDVISGGNENA